jgi:CBS domain-containing protein
VALTSKPLLELTAADLMSAALVLIPQQMSLKDAARRLADAAVSGAPVVDDHGRCIGVISATDFVHWIDRRVPHQPAACATSPAFWAAWQMADPGALPEEMVRDHMTRDPAVVAPTATLAELARKMVDVHFHRVIVTDPGAKPLGIVSSTDILAAVVREDQARQPVNPPRGH